MYIKKATKKLTGSCNSCNDTNYYFVYDVTINNLSFRLCNICRMRLSKMLKAAYYRDIVAEDYFMSSGN